MREAQEVESFRFSLSTSPPVRGSAPPELDQSRLVWMQFQPELRQPLSKVAKKPLGVLTVLETYNQIVGITDDNYVAARHPLPPCFHPLIEHVVQVDVS